MVAHGVAQILQRHFLIGDDPERHLLGVSILACGIGHIGREIISEAIEEAPHTGLTIATAREVGSGIRTIIGEVGILALKPAHRAGIAHDIVGAYHQIGDGLLGSKGVFLAEQVGHLHTRVAAIEELRDTALVGVCGDGIVGDAYSHPYGAFLRLRAVRTAAHHLQHPGLVLVCH